MANKSLSYDTGLVTFDINGDESKTITFNPTDQMLAKRIFDAVKRLDDRQEKLKEEAQKLTDPKDVLDFYEKMDSDIRAEIDAAFGEKISEKVFGDISTFAYGNGLPIWANFLLAVLELFEPAVIQEEKKTNPRIEKYMKKYGQNKR